MLSTPNIWWKGSQGTNLKAYDLSAFSNIGILQSIIAVTSEYCGPQVNPDEWKLAELTCILIRFSVIA